MMLIDHSRPAKRLERTVNRSFCRRELIDDNARHGPLLLEQFLDRGAMRPGQHPVDVLDLRIQAIISRWTEFHHRIAVLSEQRTKLRTGDKHLSVRHLLTILHLKFELTDIVIPVRNRVGKLVDRCGNPLVHISAADDERTEEIPLARLVTAAVRRKRLWIQHLLVTERCSAKHLRLKREENEILCSRTLHTEFTLAVLLLRIKRGVEPVTFDRPQRIRHFAFAIITVHHDAQQNLLLVIRQFESV